MTKFSDTNSFLAAHAEITEASSYAMPAGTHVNPLLNEWRNTRTYAKRENLLKAVADLGIPTAGMLIVQVPGTDRLTAVFAKSFLGPDFARIAFKGFKVIG